MRGHTRTVPQVMESKDPDDPIKLFALPPGVYAQEPRFVPRANPSGDDDGWLLTYVFDEAQIDEAGHCMPDARSELWIIDAKGMREVVAKINLPQRVPYGLHGSWFGEDEVRGQNPYTAVRSLAGTGVDGGLLAGVHDALERWFG